MTLATDGLEVAHGGAAPVAGAGTRWRDVRDMTRADLDQWEHVHHTRLGRLRRKLMLAMPTMLGVLLYRVSRRWFLRGAHRRAHATWTLQRMLTKMDIAPWVEIGPGLMVGHAVCTVISRGRLGRNVVVFGGAVIGPREGARGFDGGAPVLGDDVVVGYGSMVFGNVTVGDGAFIGVGAIVAHDVAPGDVVIGRPARVLTAAART